MLGTVVLLRRGEDDYAIGLVNAYGKDEDGEWIDAVIFPVGEAFSQQRQLRQGEGLGEFTTDLSAAPLIESGTVEAPVAPAPIAAPTPAPVTATPPPTPDAGQPQTVTVTQADADRLQDDVAHRAGVRTVPATLADGTTVMVELAAEPEAAAVDVPADATDVPVDAPQA